MTVDLPSRKCRGRALQGLAVVTAGVLLTGCAGAPEPTASSAESSSARFPVDITSCGHTSTVTAAPERAVTLNQGATEVMLALGLEDRMAGTAYLDDEVVEKWQSAYDSVPVLADEYPSHEKLLATRPDFIYASYSSAFERKVAGTQDDLDSLQVSSYLSPFGCADEGRRPAPSFKAIWGEVDSIAAAFDVAERAAELKQRQQKTLGSVSEVGKGLDVLWYDSGTKTPTVGAGDGAPQLVLDSIGASNVFAEKSGGWAEGNWEDVLAADPDVIVLVDASWDTAADKLAYLRSDPVLSQLRAVKNDAFVTVPFSESTAGVRLVDGVRSTADQIASLTSDG